MVLRRVFILWWLLSGMAFAVEIVKAEVAPPPMDGTVSAGVFNEKGECVRVLLSHVSSDDVPSAMNGYLLAWDGKNDAGKEAPAGNYEFRGVVLGAIGLEGVAYHLNDWIDPEAPENTPVATWGVLVLPNREFLAVQKNSEEKWGIFSYRPDGSVSWSRPLAGEPTAWTTTATEAVVLREGKIEQFALADGNSEVWEGDYAEVRALAADAKGVLGVRDRELVRWAAATRQSEVVSRVPPGIRWLTVSGERYFVSDGKTVLRSEHAVFLPLDLPEIGEIRGIIAGNEASIWVVSEREGLTEFSLEGEGLRGLAAEIEESFLVASTDGSRIALLSRQAKGEKFRLIQKENSSAGVAEWKTLLQKEIHSLEHFGVEEGRIVANGLLPMEEAHRVALIENPLFPSKKGTITVKPAIFEGGLWLITGKGLPLVPVFADAISPRTSLLPGKKNGNFKLLAAIHGAVAEFAVSGFSNAMLFTSDKIQWPPGPRKSADESNLPE